MTKILLVMVLVLQIMTFAILARGVSVFSQAASCNNRPALLWRST